MPFCLILWSKYSFVDCSNLEVKVVQLDELMLNPEKPSSEFVKDLDTKLLKTVKDEIALGGIVEGFHSSCKNSHVKLWKFLGQVSDIPL